MAQDSLNVASMPQNDATPKEIRTRSTFPLAYHLFNTHRFGEYSPHFVMDGVQGDRLPILSSHRIDSYSLNAPLMQDISLKKDYYEVPLEAILPKNFDKWYTNPTQGDDCPDDAGPGLYRFWNLAGGASTACVVALRSILSDTTKTEAQKLTAVLRYLVFVEYLYSNGSLMTSLGCHGAAHGRLTGQNATYLLPNGSIDEYIDRICQEFIDGTSGIEQLEFYSDGTTYWCSVTPTTMSSQLHQLRPTCTFRDMLQYFRDDPTSYVTTVQMIGSGTIQAKVSPYLSGANYSFGFDTTSNVHMDFRRLWAYQLCCAHFYSNDHIDYIYSAVLYRQLVQYYLREISATPATFSMNGLTYEYDYLSGHNVGVVFSWIASNATAFLEGSSSAAMGALGYVGALFSYRRSLRFMDYFTGSRTRPLAVGDVNVDVQNGTPNFVSVIDTTQKIQKQKFLNAVNRFGRKFEEYIKGLSGIEPNVDYHNPLYLAHTSDSIFAREVENTGPAQLTDANSVTARLSASGGRYQFDVSIDRPCVVIGICYFDITRVYKFSTERQFFNLNRFDEFNPYMQFIGDQPVYGPELGSDRPRGWYTWGYQLRHMEYKQRYSQSAGGFVYNLPGYLFDNQNDSSRSRSFQNPDYIRSMSSELDRYFVSLNGYSLGSYFHFIVDHFNDCDASRPMAFAPSIL